MTQSTIPNAESATTVATSTTPPPRAPARPTSNPLRQALSHGKMPVMLELHLTEGDRLGYEGLRRRYLSASTGLPDLTFLGQYLRQMDLASEDLSRVERRLAGKLQEYAELIGAGKIDLIALDDGARGKDTLDNAVAAELLTGLGVDASRLIANVVARNRTAQRIQHRLLHFARIGLRNVLLLTGDLPSTGTAQFPLDSVGMCELARNMIIRGELPDDFLIAAAGHPNPDADPDGLRTLQKALAGARVIITQAVFSAELFERWMASLDRLGVLDMVHLIAEVIPLASKRQLTVLRDIPGMRIPPELMEEFGVLEERIDVSAQQLGHDEAWVRLERDRQGARITRNLLHRIRRVRGVSGFYLGCVKSSRAHQELLKETPLLPEQADTSHQPARVWGTERQRALAQQPSVEAYLARLVRRAQSQRRSSITRIIRRVAQSSWLESLLKVLEWPKVPLFGCRMCDRCELSTTALVCPRGCAKQMSHGACGAPRFVDGKYLCEDTSRECTWVAIRDRRAALGVPLAEQLAVHRAPSPAFFEGKTFSAWLPVLAGDKPGPNWRLAYRAPLAWITRRDRSSSSRTNPPVQSGPPVPDLGVLVASRKETITAMLRDDPDMDVEELFIKTMALIGTPAALHLIEARMAHMGLPAEGSLADLSIRELFRLGETLPRVRASMALTSARGRPREGVRGVVSRSEELLAVIGEGTSLRRALRRELANGLVRHITSLGVSVSYTDVLLSDRHVDSFLQAMTILKNELQLVRSNLAGLGGTISAHFNRIHYRHHYRAPVAIRRFVDDNDDAAPKQELVIDMRRFESPSQFRSNLRATLEKLCAGSGESAGEIVLEAFGEESQSLCWSFNGVFWKRLAEFEAATGVDYDESIGGSTDHNLAYVRSTARAFFDRIQARGLGDQPLLILEIGVASTQRAQAFLGELRRLCELTGTHHCDRTTYLLADFSETILARSREELLAVHPHVEAVHLDAADPLKTLDAYRGRIMHAHLCNVYDNLPTDKLAWIDGRLYNAQSRLYLPRDAASDLLAAHGFASDDLDAFEDRLHAAASQGQRGVEELLDWARDRLVERGESPQAYVAFWMQLASALRAEERYVPIADQHNASWDPTPGVSLTAEWLAGQLPRERNVRMHLNQAAIQGFAQLLGILHPHGTLEVVDLFVQRIEEYYDRFKGPAKYDGSTVNWLNGPLFREAARQLGFSVRFHPFRPFDPRSPSVILWASRDS